MLINKLKQSFINSLTAVIYFLNAPFLDLFFSEHDYNENVFHKYQWSDSNMFGIRLKVKGWRIWKCKHLPNYNLNEC